MQTEQQNSSKTPLPTCWMNHLSQEFDSAYMSQIKSFLADELKKGKVIYPHGSLIFSAFNLTPLDQVKVVVVGQDPFHGEGQAHGLSFSVRPGVQVPPSLQNIYKELNADLGIAPVKDGHLEKWAKQGVLLLNAVLTVEANNAASHANIGWEKFTDKVIEVLNRERENVVFFLWGAYAQKKGASIDRKKHLVIESPHPSPLSAHRGFFGTRPFSKANDYLKAHGLKPINWSLAD